MRIERYYFKESAERAKRIEEEIANEEEALTEEERRLRTEKTHKEAEFIKSRGQCILNAIRYVTSEKMV